MEKKMNSQSPGGSLILKLKDFRILQLDINTTDELNSIFTTLEKLSSLGKKKIYKKKLKVMISFLFQINYHSTPFSSDQSQ